MKTSVNFEIAKLLTHTDFNQKSVDEGYVISTGELSHDYPLDYMNGKAIAAPTIAEVVMWFYEKHGIWISIEQNTYEDKFDYLITQRNEDSSWFVVGNDEKIIKSPTEAYEAAIEYTLKHLI